MSCRRCGDPRPPRKHYCDHCRVLVRRMQWRVFNRHGTRCIGCQARMVDRRRFRYCAACRFVARRIERGSDIVTLLAGKCRVCGDGIPARRWYCAPCATALRRLTANGYAKKARRRRKLEAIRAFKAAVA